MKADFPDTRPESMPTALNECHVNQYINLSTHFRSRKSVLHCCIYVDRVVSFSSLTCCLFVRGCACSVYGALLFNFGSLLLFAVAKSYLPENSNLATLAGLASCYSLVKVGTSYLDHIDSNIKPQLK